MVERHRHLNQVVLPDGTPAGDGELPTLYSGAVDTHFAGAYGVRLEQGRFFDARDRADTDPVVVLAEVGRRAVRVGL